MKYLLLFIAVFSLSSCSKKSVECGDLLAERNIKPLNLEFVGCKKGTGQTVLSAEYKVSGKNSKKVENILVTKYGMGELKSLCCGWEPHEGKKGQIEDQGLKDINQNYTLSISMHGNAEKENSKGEAYVEKDRNNVSFSVTVELLDV